MLFSFTYNFVFSLYRKWIVLQIGLLLVCDEQYFGIFLL